MHLQEPMARIVELWLALAELVALIEVGIISGKYGEFRLGFALELSSGDAPQQHGTHRNIT